MQSRKPSSGNYEAPEAEPGGRSQIEANEDEATTAVDGVAEPTEPGSGRSNDRSQETNKIPSTPAEEQGDSGFANGNSRFAVLVVKSCKLILYLGLAVSLLASATLSKATLLIMTSFLRSSEEANNHGEIPDEERLAWIGVTLFVAVFDQILMFRGSSHFRSSPCTLTWPDTFVVTFFESVYILGLASLLFLALPELDVVQGLIVTTYAGIVPLVLATASRNNSEWNPWIKRITAVFALTAVIFSMIVEFSHGETSFVWAKFVAPVFISAVWWKSFVDRRSPCLPIRYLAGLKERCQTQTYKMDFALLVWKTALFLSLASLFLLVRGINIFLLMTKAPEAMGSDVATKNQIWKDQSGEVVGFQIEEFVVGPNKITAALSIMLLHILAAYLAYSSAKYACKIFTRLYTLSIPLLLGSPLSILILGSMCGLENQYTHFSNEYPGVHRYFNCPSNSSFEDIFSQNYGGWFILWLVSQLWVAIHIFLPTIESSVQKERVHVNPAYSSIIIEQSLTMDHKQDVEVEVDRIKSQDVNIDTTEDEYDPSLALDSETIARDSVSTIYACATMWHETRVEMLGLMRSLFRMDHDQSSRSATQEELDIVDEDFYIFETHIFFDDAFEISDVHNDWMQVNSYVREFIDCVDEAASYVHLEHKRIEPPKLVPTPYGGRLEYTLPCKTRMYVHLKDKSKIRHKKRWSQCMYMYYLLGHRLQDLPISKERKAIRAENTYILALDGDIDFQPPAVTLVVDLMKKDNCLGAACGRIHPVGNGPMVWYQLFEYAIGHWLQKAAEHVIGCVMCSPGCFSLFRAKALLDVMDIYTTKAEEPLYCIQYDQGEDRWLCTLLLQKGYRVEYTAASDSFTHAPDDFDIFFKQRRRWVPSTIINILDVIKSFRETMEINRSISQNFIIYQCILMVGTVIGPGTIFLMLVGASMAAFNISYLDSFHYNLYPILFHIIVCLTMESDYQLKISKLLSVFYALVMLATIVGTILQMGDEGVSSPSSIFLVALAISFSIAALVHPQELWCIVPGIFYLLCIPSMYLLLIIYSATNLNVVSWGTRESAAKKGLMDLNTVSDNSRSSSWNGSDESEPEGSGIDVDLHDVMRIMAYTKHQENPDHRLLALMVDTLEGIDRRLDHLKKAVHASFSEEIGRNIFPTPCGDSANAEGNSGKAAFEPRDDLINPYWVNEALLSESVVEPINKSEVKFWRELIDRYLLPLDTDKAKQDLMTLGLKRLRNWTVFGLSAFSVVFVCIMLYFTLIKDDFYIHWPLGVQETITITEDGGAIITKKFMQLQPVGVVIMIFFFLIICIQFLAMIIHRITTLSHVLSSVGLSSLNIDKGRRKKPTADPNPGSEEDLTFTEDGEMS